jgi:hypothetical protein
VSGPLFTGRTGTQIDRAVELAERELAAQAYAEVMTNLDRSIKHPTPYYETQITVNQRGRERVVHDRGIVYGPWLEGTSERNRSTRFKGYASFRRARQTLAGKARAIVEASLRRSLRGI